MRLCDNDIRKAMTEGAIQFTPPPSDDAIGAVSVDLTLGTQFRTFRSHGTPFLDLSGDKRELQKAIADVMSDEIIIEGDKMFVLHPGELALGITAEKVTLPSNIVGWLDGRSSLARLGLLVHVTAHRIDPGWAGNIVLEFYNAGKLPLGLKPGMAIGAVSFEMMSGHASKPYGERKSSKYKDQSGPVESRISND